MVAYSFKEQFAGLIESGEKTQTIRAIGKRRHVRPGEKIQLYTGIRTKSCRKLGEAVCSEVLPIEMSFLRLACQSASYSDGETAEDENGHRFFVIKSKPIAQITRLYIWGRPEMIIGQNPVNWPDGNEILDNFARKDGFCGRPGLLPAQEMAEFFVREHGAGEFKGRLIKWELQNGS